MPALLTAIIFDEKTNTYLQECMKRHEDEALSGMLDTFGEFDDTVIKLKKLPAGEYILIISMDIENHNTAELTLMNAGTRDVITQSTLDLAPVIETGILYRDDYDAANAGFSAEDSNEQEDSEFDQKIEAISRERCQSFKDILKPYISGSHDFDENLLDMLDLATHYFVLEKMEEVEQTPVPKSVENDPLHKLMPPSSLLH